MMRRTTILLIEDDAAMLDFLAEELDASGFAVLRAMNAAEALSKVPPDEAPPDVVVTDVRLGGDDGISLLTELRSRLSRDGGATEPGFVVVSAFGNLDTAIRAFRAGASDFLPKPFDIQALRLSIERVLEQQRLRGEIRRLRTEIGWRGPGSIVAVSAPMRAVLALAERAAPSEATVLLTGPSGTGKELLARMVHERSARARGPFVAVNCAAIPEALLESELFGHRKGAFTEARTHHDGLFKAAERGTLFLDEIGELPLEFQPKLLRAMKDREIRAVGATRSEPIDVRVVAATNRRLEERVAEGRFREDLFYRINVIQLELAPLAERTEDILPLAQAFLARGRTPDQPMPTLSPDARDALLRYRWPGNVRELENAIERAVALCADGTVGLSDLPPKIVRPEPPRLVEGALERGLTLEELSNEYCVAVVRQHGGNQSAAARQLDIDRKTLARRLAAAGMRAAEEPAAKPA